MGLLASVQSKATKKPPRTVLYAREKWGKSSLGAYAPKPFFFMTRGETGLVELISQGKIPDTPHLPYDPENPPTWNTLIATVKELITDPHDYRTFLIDTSNGAEAMCADHVRKTFFKNDQAKFNSYGKGMVQCRVLWTDFLALLDRLRESRGVSPLMLAHTAIKKFEDPTSDEAYDRYKPACEEKLWELTHKWADCICFGHFQPQLYETDSGKTKAKNEMVRRIFFDQSPCWEAGNRYDIAGSVDASNGAKQAWADFAARFGGRYELPLPQGKTPPAPKLDPVLFGQMLKFIENAKDAGELQPQWQQFHLSREKFTPDQYTQGEALKNRLKEKFATEAAAKAATTVPPITAGHPTNAERLAKCRTWLAANIDKNTAEDFPEKVVKFLDEKFAAFAAYTPGELERAILAALPESARVNELLPTELATARKAVTDFAATLVAKGGA